MLVKEMPAWMRLDYYRTQIKRLRDSDPHGLLGMCEADLERTEIELTEEAKLPFQARALAWVRVCFGETKASDKDHRNKRFLEESLELVQAGGMTKEVALKLVEYVYGREKGEIPQEVGGVMTTLAAWCGANDVDMHACAEDELTRIWGKVDAIREKEKGKPDFEAEKEKRNPNLRNLGSRYRALKPSQKRSIAISLNIMSTYEYGALTNDDVRFRRIVDVVLKKAMHEDFAIAVGEYEAINEEE